MFWPEKIVSKVTLSGVTPLLGQNLVTLFLGQSVVEAGPKAA